MNPPKSSTFLAACSSLLLLLTQPIAAASGTDADNLHIGCWDDQFNGTASSHLLITPDKIVVAYDDYPPPYEHDIVANYTSYFSPGNDKMNEQGVSFITKNVPDGSYSDFDMMIDSSDVAMDFIYYCQINFNETSANEAAKEDKDVSYLDLDGGCNTFPWSKLHRADSDDECKDLIAADAESVDAPSSAFIMPGSSAAAVAIMAALFGIIAM